MTTPEPSAPTPPPSVLDVISAVNALLPSGVAARIGPEHAGESIAPPRVVWIPMTDSFTAPLNHAGAPRSPVWTVESSWDVVLLCKGDDRTDPTASFRALEVLRDAVICAIHKVARGNASIIAGRFDQQDDSAISRFGRSYTLSVRFSLDVSPASAATASALISAVHLTGALSALKSEV